MRERPVRPTAPTFEQPSTGGSISYDGAGRFVAVRHEPTSDVPVVHYIVEDTHRANILGHGHTNRVRVFSLIDASALTHRVLLREWAAAVDAWERRAATTSRRRLAVAS
jgi:hypothetical protein